MGGCGHMHPTRAGILGVCLAASLLAGQVGAGVQWHDAADAAGIRFRLAGEVHEGIGTSWPAFAEVLGGGACWFDFDGDGYEDLYLVNQAYNADNPAVDAAWARAADPHSQLYRNEGDGSFSDVSAEAGVDGRGWGMGCSAADYDGDGHTDLFVAHFGDNLLFRNRGDGTFANVSASSGVAMPGKCGAFRCLSTGSAWGDADNDGDLDLYVGTYLDTNTTDLIRGPQDHNAQLNFLHRNNGDGTFTEVAQVAGCAGDTGELGAKSFGVAWLDVDLDGDLDIYVANDSTPNLLFLNQGDGTFVEGASQAGVADARASMGLTVADYDRDGLPDLYFTHYADQHNGFFRNRGDGTFEDRSGEDGLAEEWDYVGWGTAFVDWDRDGDLDLFVVNGHTEPFAARASNQEPLYDQPALVFRHDAPLPGGDPADATWVDVSGSAGPGITTRSVARGAAFADYDLDGDVDVAVVNNGNETARLLEGSGVAQSWLYVTLAQPGMNRHALSARVLLEAAGRAQALVVEAGGSYASQNSRALAFGLGPATHADRVTVQWPGGGTTEVRDLAAGQVVRIDRATGTWTNDTLSPRTALVLPAGASDGWFRVPIEARLDARDLGVGVPSGVARTEVALGAGDWQPYAGQALAFGEGVARLRFRSADVASNLEPVRAGEVRVDLTGPSARHGLEAVMGTGGWAVEPVRVTLGMDDALSGPGPMRYRIGEAGAWHDYEGPFDVGDDGVHRVAYVASDRAGNQAAQAGFELRLDRTPPRVTLLDPAPGAVYVAGARAADLGRGPAVVVAVDPFAGVGDTVLTLRADAEDATSGVRQVRFFVDGAEVGVARAAPYTLRWDAGRAALGVHEVEAIALDQAGNVASARVLVLVVPATQPGIQRTLGDGPSLPPGWA